MTGVMRIKRPERNRGAADGLASRAVHYNAADGPGRGRRGWWDLLARRDAPGDKAEDDQTDDE
jgi:hypothetical protein